VTPTIRPFVAPDTPELLSVLGRVFDEYGMRFDPDGYDRDVKDVASRYAPPLGVFLAVEDEGKVLGFGGADLPREGVAEIHRLYLDPRARGRGLGKLLVERLERWARERVRNMVLWSDVRFCHAHELYARLGYRLNGQRTLDDPDRSVEFGFRRHLTDAVDDRPFVADFTFRPIERLSPEETHRAAMVTAAILDARALPRGEDRAHVLPSPRQLFSPEGSSVEAVFQRPHVLAGFRSGDERRLHPLFSSRLSSR
jgi:GNAT superfamily N-acetyltransferase